MQTLTEQLLWQHLSLPLWNSLLSGWHCTSAGGLQISITGTQTHFIPKYWGSEMSYSLKTCTELQTHLLQFAMDHKSWKTAEGKGRSATSEHLWTLQPLYVLRYQDIYTCACRQTQTHKGTPCRDYFQIKSLTSWVRKLYSTYFAFVSQPGLPGPGSIPHTRQTRLIPLQPAHTGRRSVSSKHQIVHCITSVSTKKYQAYHNAILCSTRDEMKRFYSVVNQPLPPSWNTVSQH